MNIGDVFFALRGDGSGLQVDAKKAAEAAGVAGKADKGLWLNVFCPEDSCLWKGGTDLA